MTKFLALNMSVSQDGFMAGPNQSLDAPLGENGEQLLQWAWGTTAVREWSGLSGGTTGFNDDSWRRIFSVGANIMGRNMFGPIRGPWPNDDWKGWWGPNPGYKTPVFVLTHHAREPLDMGNGTVFNFVTGGIQQAYEMALEAANGKDVGVLGGVQTIQQFLEHELLDELQIAEVPIELKKGELLLPNPEVQLKNYQALEPIISDSIIHRRYLKK